MSFIILILLLIAILFCQKATEELAYHSGQLRAFMVADDAWLNSIEATIEQVINNTNPEHQEIVEPIIKSLITMKEDFILESIRRKIQPRSPWMAKILRLDNNKFSRQLEELGNEYASKLERLRKIDGNEE